jgi:methylated-DNA-[protein]-cysteine S-methyltransferase
VSTDLAGNLEALMQTHQDRLYCFVLRLSGNPQDAQEIVQDAFVRAYAWIASEIEHPRAVRAVGTALGRNPVPLPFPAIAQCAAMARSVFMPLPRGL